EPVGVELHPNDLRRTRIAQGPLLPVQVRCSTSSEDDLAVASLGQPLCHGDADLTAAAENQYRSAHLGQCATGRSKSGQLPEDPGAPCGSTRHRPVGTGTFRSAPAEKFPCCSSGSSGGGVLLRCLPSFPTQRFGPQRTSWL